MKCRECGDTKRLSPQGVCVWRAGCEHRQHQLEARKHRVVEEAETLLLNALGREQHKAYLRHLGFYVPEDDE